MKLPALYKRSTTNKISFWQIEVDGNKFRTESGFTDGKKIISEWTICEGKSYNSSSEQDLKQAKAIHKKKIELGAFENLKDIDNPILFNPMLAHDYNDYKDKITFPIFSQPKLDGVRCIVTSRGMFSRNGKQIISAPHIFESLKPLFEQNEDLIFDGELYAEDLHDDFNKIISCVRKTKPTKDDLEESKKWIKYHIYDLPSCDKNFIVRNQTLNSIKLPLTCKLVSTEQVDNLNDLFAYYEDYLTIGYEGQILRIPDSLYENKRSKSLLKHKTFFDSEYKIIDVIEGIGKLTGKVGTLLFETKEGKTFNSSVNGEHEYLEQLWKTKNTLIGKLATVKYFNLTPDGIPRFPKVIQIDRSWE